MPALHEGQLVVVFIEGLTESSDVAMAKDAKAGRHESLSAKI